MWENWDPERARDVTKTVGVIPAELNLNLDSRLLNLIDPSECHFRGSLKSSGTIVLTSQCREEFGKSKIIDKKWFITIGYLWDFQAGGWEMTCPGNLLGYSFIFYIIKGKVGRRRRPSLPFLSRHHASVISFFSRLTRGVFLSLHGEARSTDYCFLCVQRVCPNLLSSLGKVWVSFHYCFIAFDLVLCFWSMALLLSKPASFGG